MTGRGCIRRAEAEDLLGASQCHAEAFNALNLCHGYPKQLYPLSGVNPYFRFALDDPDTAFWVADVDDVVRGIGIASVFNEIWFMSHLFVDPNTQSQGLGKRLLEQTMDDEHLPDASNRALVTMAYNTSSLGLYARYGLVPRTMIYRLESDSQSIVAPRFNPSPLVPATGDRSHLVFVLQSVDRKTLSVDRPWHHSYFLSCSNARCLLMYREDEVEGYVYVWDDGRIGPAGATSKSRIRDLFEASVVEASQRSTGSVSTFISPDDVQIFEIALSMGMRITLPFVLLSSKALRPIRNYAYHSPGLL